MILSCAVGLVVVRVVHGPSSAYFLWLDYFPLLLIGKKWRQNVYFITGLANFLKTEIIFMIMNIGMYQATLSKLLTRVQFIFHFTTKIKWPRVGAQNRVGRVTVNRHIFFWGLKVKWKIIISHVYRWQNDSN